MDKEKFLKMRKIEKEEEKAYCQVGYIFDFLNDYEDYIYKFKSEEAKKAIKDLDVVQELLRGKGKSLGKIFRDERLKYEKVCTHDIVFFDDREGYENDPFFCALCRNDVQKEDLKDNTMIIGVQDIYNCNSPGQGSLAYEVIDYMIENDLDFTEEEFFKTYNILFPEGFYKQFKENYKVRVKK